RVRVGHAHGGGFDDVGVLHRHRLHFVGVHVEPRNHDHVFLAVFDVQVTLFVDQPNVAGAQKAVGMEGGGGFVGPVPVAAAYLRPAHTDLADFPNAQILVGMVGDCDFRGRNGQADRAGEVAPVERVDAHGR